jgi:hypothetical protein
LTTWLRDAKLHQPKKLRWSEAGSSPAAPSTESRSGNVRTFGDLIDLHNEDMHEVGKPPRRSKAAVMASLKIALGGVKLSALNRERLIEFGRKRAKQGAGPATLAIDMSFIRTIITHAAAVHGIKVSAEEARLARVALSHLNLVGKGKERDRRPTQDELDELIEYFETNRRQFLPMVRIVKYRPTPILRGVMR